MALFPEFPAATYQDWLDQLQKELKGAETSRFTHHTVEGIRVPTYISDSYKNADVSPLLYKASRKEAFENINSWRACVDIDTDDLAASNKTALQLLLRGAGSIRFTGFGISNQEELRLLMRGIRPDYIYTHFDCGEANPSLLFMFHDELMKMELNANEINGSLAYDPFGDFAFRGSMASNLEETLQVGNALVNFNRTALPAFKTLNINGSGWHNAGAKVPHELGIILSCMAEYLIQLKSPEESASSMALRMASGADFFSSMAKFRAIRLLWARLLTGFSLNASQIPLWVSAETSLRNKTIYDPWNNLLRSTTEAMAAVIAGADELTVHPHDAVFKSPAEHSRRVALNVHHILRYESHLDLVADAAAGASYIENLTQEIIEEAWNFFLEIERKGGYLAALKKGWIQEQIATSRKQMEQEFRSGKRALVGINKFARPEEKGVEPLEIRRDPLEKLPEIKPLELYREATLIEQIRNKITNQSPAPHAFLATFGDIKRAADRATFSSEFMAMAGIRSYRGEPGVSLIDQLYSTHAKNAFVIVLCSADEAYLNAVLTIRKDRWPDKPVWIAGRPQEMDQLKTNGIDGFIYAGCDSLPVFYQLTEHR
jgi:methylmalonyl-CoA mutase